MFAPLSPILAADDGADAQAQVVLGQFESMTPVLAVLAVIARLAGVAPQARAGLLEQSADLSAVLASLPPERMRFAAEQLETLGMVLQAGLIALENARTTGRFNRAAALLLHAEASGLYRDILHDLGRSGHH
ncbi:hypothetical protein [Blastomonas fulva]|uniref:hypothetical protein n=1 Tax=Blastomonas fulva TaxID=1550728 RepID=UPI003F6F6B2A